MIEEESIHTEKPQKPRSPQEEAVYGLFTEALEVHGAEKIANNIGITVSTVKRWILLDSVPKEYIFDLMRMLDREIDFENYTITEKDQYFTPTETAQTCLTVFQEKIHKLGIEEEELTYIEPSAGSGAFFGLLPVNRRIGIDIEPKSDGIICADFLCWQPASAGNYVVIGNPPFGLRGHTALNFINHSYPFADFVAFILPQFFESDGKGTPRKRVKGYNLIYSEPVSSSFSYPTGKDVAVNVVFQIWSKKFSEKEFTIEEREKSIIKIYSLSDGNSPSTTRNKKMIGKCDVYIPSTCFGADKMKVYDSFEELPNRKGYGVVFLGDNDNSSIAFRSVKWEEVSFRSTNSALNLRTSIIEREFSREINKTS